MNLVVPGTHQQYLEWLANHDANPADYRPVTREEHLRAVRAADIDDLVLVGTYWDNRAWGCEDYRALLAEGLHQGKPWAERWPAQWAQAALLRDLPEVWARSPGDEAAAAQARHEAIERLLGG